MNENVKKRCFALSFKRKYSIIKQVVNVNKLISHVDRTGRVHVHMEKDV